MILVFSVVVWFADGGFWQGISAMRMGLVEGRGGEGWRGFG